MKSLKESLFDTDLISSDFINLYQTFGKNITSIYFNRNDLLVFNKFVDRRFIDRSKYINKEWVNYNKPKLDGSFNKSRFNNFFIKILSVILASSNIFEKDLINYHDDEMGPLSSINFGGDTPDITVYLIKPESIKKHWKKGGYEIRILLSQESYITCDCYLLTDKMVLT